MNTRGCKNCKWLHKYYGNKDKAGKPTVSNYCCTKKNGFIKRFPKECSMKVEKN